MKIKNITAFIILLSLIVSCQDEQQNDSETQNTGILQDIQNRFGFYDDDDDVNKNNAIDNKQIGLNNKTSNNSNDDLNNKKGSINNIVIKDGNTSDNTSDNRYTDDKNNSDYDESENKENYVDTRNDTGNNTSINDSSSDEENNYNNSENSGVNNSYNNNVDNTNTSGRSNDNSDDDNNNESGNDGYSNNNTVYDDSYEVSQNDTSNNNVNNNYSDEQNNTDARSNDVNTPNNTDANNVYSNNDNNKTSVKNGSNDVNTQNNAGNNTGINNGFNKFDNNGKKVVIYTSDNDSLNTKSVLDINENADGNSEIKDSINNGSSLFKFYVHNVNVSAGYYSPDLGFIDNYITDNNGTGSEIGGNVIWGGNIVLNIMTELRARFGVSYFSSKIDEQNGEEILIKNFKLSMLQYKLGVLYYPKFLKVKDVLNPYVGAEAKFQTIKNNTEILTGMYKEADQKGQDYCFAPVIGIEANFNHIITGVEYMFNVGNYVQETYGNTPDEIIGNVVSVNGSEIMFFIGYRF